jgi:glycosyltransferase involved in cell wall biosynthesis
MVSSELESSTENYLILTPLFDDWQSLGLLVVELDKALSGSGMFAEVLVVDDASTIPIDHACFEVRNLNAIKKISVLELTRNFGHQRAIAIGLAYVAANMPCQGVVVMDSDGEDDPKDVPRLIEKCRETGNQKMVFAVRAKRSEGRVFTLFYSLYKGLFRLLTGQSIHVGNFSLVPRRILHRLVHVSEIWNHYAVGVIKSKIPTVEILTNRGRRMAGESRMNFVSLVVHGLSAISVFGDVIGIRLLISTILLLVVVSFGIAVTVTIKFATTLAIPGWATYVGGILFIIGLQALILSVFFIFIILNSRNSVTFLPAKEYAPFILRFQTIFLAE